VIPAPTNLSSDLPLESLRAAGIRPRILEPTLFLSIPEAADLLVDGRTVEAWPAAFARSTGDESVDGALRLVDPDEPHALAGAIAVVDGALTPDAVYSLERRGAAGQVYIAGDGWPERSCSTIWGAPTHESIPRKPRTPVVVVGERSGEDLRQHALLGDRARLSTRLREGWMQAPLAIVDIHGVHDHEEFVLVHGSDDQALLALAHDLHARRGELTRSVRVAWWPDRALGSAAASAWYADAFAAELDEWCVAHVSTGGTSRDDAFWMPEAAELCLASIAAAGQGPIKGRRPPREADYSFNQIGVTGLFGGHAFPSSVYVNAVVHIANAAIYPFDYTAPVLEMGAAVQRYQAAAGNELDLGGVSQDLARLRRAIGAWRSDADTELHRHPADSILRRRSNTTMRRLARVLVPLGFARGERFDHDPALRFSALPRLEGALHVAETPEPMRSFVRTAILRESNKIRAAIRQALMLVT
jgi:hypothetical protein